LRCPSPRPWMPQQRGRRRAANVKEARPGQQQHTPGWTQDTGRRGIREGGTQQGTDRSTRRVTSAHCCSSAAAQQRLGRQPVLLTPQGGPCTRHPLRWRGQTRREHGARLEARRKHSSVAGLSVARSELGRSQLQQHSLQVGFHGRPSHLVHIVEVEERVCEGWARRAEGSAYNGY
jgi:hypothetical protein